MRKLLYLIAVLCFALKAPAQPARPRLVVGLVIDQMRWDYLYYYYNEYGKGGLRRLLNKGFSCNNTMIDYIPTVTAAGHTSIFTGSVPALHGIAGNGFAIHDKEVYCCADSTVRSVGSQGRDGEMSPHRMLASTIGDVLKTATDFKSKVIGIALKDRAAILPAGHSADAAYWWDTEAGHFVSSTYYMKELPLWVQKFNQDYHTPANFNIKTNPIGVTYTFRMAEAALQNERLGQHDVTDMLTVSISSTDAIGHVYSTRGKENKEVYLQLDKDLAHFMQVLDAQVGRGNYLLFLTADHGAVHNYNWMQSHQIPGGGWNYQHTTQELNKYLRQQLGIEPVMFEDNYQLFLDDANIQNSGISKQKVVDCAIKFLEQDDNFLFVVDNAHAATASIPEVIKQRLINGYNRLRSGEITVIPRAGYFGVSKPDKNYKGTSHGEWNPYDAHIPCIFMGWKVQSGSINRPTNMTDIAPTVCALLHIQMPNSCIGNPITEVAP